MAETYKLYYFNIYGRAELSRLIFAQAGVPYEDIRFSKEEWASEYKQKSPFGVCPWLELQDGRVIGDSKIIARYLGEKFDLAGRDEVENAFLDSIASAYFEFAQEAVKPFFVKDEEAKQKLIKEFKPNKLDKIEAKIPSEGAWFLGDRLTWVDIAVYNGLSFICTAYPNLLESYPRLAAIANNVPTLPKIKEWIEKRPKTSVILQ